MKTVAFIVTAGALSFASAALANLPETHHGNGGQVSDFSAGVPGVSLFQITVTEHGELKDVSSVSILTFRQTFAGDLKITLRHEDTGTAVVLLDRPGVPESEFGDSADFIFPNYTWQDGGFVYDDDVFDLFVTTTLLGPVSGSLLDFEGEDKFGIWTLEFIDYAAGNAGALGGWDLSFNTVPGPGVLCALICGAMVRRRQRPIE